MDAVNNQYYHHLTKHDGEDKEHHSDSEMYDLRFSSDQYERHNRKLGYLFKRGKTAIPGKISKSSFIVFIMVQNYVYQLYAVIMKKSPQTVVSFIFGVVVGITLTAMLFQHNFLMWGSKNQETEYLLGNGFVQNTHDMVDRLKDNYEVEQNKYETDVYVEPIINTDSFVEHAPDKRPDLLKDEINLGSKIFVGVITAEKFLSSRAIAVNSTWGSQVDKIAFFTELGSASQYGIPVVNLKGVSDKEYPPQKKAFNMLKYMCNNHIDEYDWFVRADDDVYIRVEKLKNFLSQIDSNKLIYMGQPGHGVPEVREKLGLNGHNFCMGGPSVIFNRKALKELCSHLDECMAEVVSGEEDVEIGRCVSNHLHIECTHAWETLKLFYHSYQEEYTEERPFLGNLAENIHVQKAITLHHVKLPYIMYKIHRHFTSLLLNSSTQEITYLRKQGDSLNEVLPLSKHRQLSTVKLSPQFFKAKRIQDITSWKSFNVESVFELSYVSPSRDITNDVLADLKQIGETAIDVAIDRSAPHLTYSHLSGGYFRTDSLRGTDYLLDIFFSSKEDGKSDEVKRVHILRPLTDFQLTKIEEIQDTETPHTFYVIIPLRATESASDDLERFIRKYYEPVFLQTSPKEHVQTNLIISMYGSESDVAVKSPDSAAPSVQDVVSWFQVKYPQSGIEVIHFTPNEDSDLEQNVRAYNIDRAYDKALAHIVHSPNAKDTDIILMTLTNFSISENILKSCRHRVNLVRQPNKVDEDLGASPNKKIWFYESVPFAVYPAIDSYKGKSIPTKDVGYWFVPDESNGKMQLPICGLFSNFASLFDNKAISIADTLYNSVYDSKYLLQRVPDKSIVFKSIR